MPSDTCFWCHCVWLLSLKAIIADTGVTGTCKRWCMASSVDSPSLLVAGAPWDKVTPMLLPPWPAGSQVYQWSWESFREILWEHELYWDTNDCVCLCVMCCHTGLQCNTVPSMFVSALCASMDLYVCINSDKKNKSPSFFLSLSHSVIRSLPFALYLSLSFTTFIRTRRPGRKCFWNNSRAFRFGSGSAKGCQFRETTCIWLERTSCRPPLPNWLDL